MHHKTRLKLIYLISSIIFISVGVFVILYNLSDNISYYVTPTELESRHIKDRIKLGGYVKSGSIQKKDKNITEFYITDYNTDIKVRYKGNIPAIFRDNQGVIVSGKVTQFSNEVSSLKHLFFTAESLIVKHDETYIPKK